MPINLCRTNSSNPDFIFLVEQLDADLAVRDGDDHPFYAQFNTLDAIKYVIVAYEDEKAIACGAIKQFDQASMEIKRMYTLPEARGRGIASLILAELESWAEELGFSRCILETGFKQPEAIALYEKNGYVRIENYGQYAGVENSLCFEKDVS